MVPKRGKVTAVGLVVVVKLPAATVLSAVEGPAVMEAAAAVDMEAAAVAGMAAAASSQSERT